MEKKTILAVVALLLIICSVSFGSATLYTPAAGDAQYSWNGSTGPYGYTTGTTTMGVYLSLGYGNDYTVSIFEIPIFALSGQTLTNATLQVDSLGFDTGYYYGSAQIGWLDTGTRVLTGDVVADALGSMSPRPSGPEIYDTYDVSGAPGTKLFDFTSLVQADLDAGRSYSTFVMHGSRETYGSIYTAESGSGPRIIADTTAVVPIPGSLSLGVLGVLLVSRLRKK